MWPSLGMHVLDGVHLDKDSGIVNYGEKEGEGSVMNNRVLILLLEQEILFIELSLPEYALFMACNAGASVIFVTFLDSPFFSLHTCILCITLQLDVCKCMRLFPRKYGRPFVKLEESSLNPFILVGAKIGQ